MLMGTTKVHATLCCPDANNPRPVSLPFTRSPWVISFIPRVSNSSSKLMAPCSSSRLPMARLCVCCVFLSPLSRDRPSTTQVPSRLPLKNNLSLWMYSLNRNSSISYYLFNSSHLTLWLLLHTFNTWQYLRQHPPSQIQLVPEPRVLGPFQLSATSEEPANGLLVLTVG